MLTRRTGFTVLHSSRRVAGRFTQTFHLFAKPIEIIQSERKFLPDKPTKVDVMSQVERSSTKSSYRMMILVTYLYPIMAITFILIILRYGWKKELKIYNSQQRNN